MIYVLTDKAPLMHHPVSHHTSPEQEGALKEFLNKYDANIAGTLTCFDRIIFKGHLPISWPEGMESFLRREKVLIKDFKSYVTKISERVKDHARQMAEDAERPYIHLRRQTDKEADARAMAERDGITEGLVCVYTRVEQAQSFKLQVGKGRPRLRCAQPRCLCIYFYIIDPAFGLIHIRLQTWFPFTIQVYLNGHDWLARQLQRKNIEFELIENAFVACADWEKAQRVANSFAGLNWSFRLERMARQVNPLMKDLLKGMRHRWSIEQAEHATDVVFTNIRLLARLYPQLVEHATLRWGSADVLGFLGRKLDGRFTGECRSSAKRTWRANPRLQGVRVKHWVNRNAIKMYNKQPTLLRIETVINRPYEFKVRRPGIKKGEPVVDWFRMSKSVRYLPRYAEVALQANSRYLQGLSVVEDLSGFVQTIDSICEPAVRQSRRAPALNPLRKREVALFAAVLRGEHTLHGFTSRQLLHAAGIRPPACPVKRRRLSSKVYRRLNTLRVHGLLAKIPRSRRWRVTKRGHALMSAALKLKTHELPTQLLALAA